MKFTRRLLSSQNQKGIAVLLAVFCVVLITYLVTEVTYDTTVEYSIHAGAINRLKAYYAARSGLELSLLRIKIYRKVQKQFGKQLGPQSRMLNLVWSFPLSWPPIMPESTTEVNKDSVKDAVKESKMDATYNATIFDEGSKIDLNDLMSPSKTIRDITKKQLLKIFEAKRINDPDWLKAHSNFRAEELVNNIIDWEDPDKQALNGGDERALYKNLPADLNVEFYPPNRAFRTLDELRLVAGMTDELFDLLAPLVTIYGAKALNPNTASSDVIKYLDPSITDEVVKAVVERRDDPNQGGPFTSAQEFWNFINSKGGRVDNDVMQDTPLIFDAVTNFRIRSIGEYHGAIREIDAIVFDLPTAATVVADKVKKETNSGGANPNPNPNSNTNPNPNPGAASSGTATPAANNNQTASKGPPRIVYWSEK